MSYLYPDAVALRDRENHLAAAAMERLKRARRSVMDEGKVSAHDYVRWVRLHGMHGDSDTIERPKAAEKPVKKAVVKQPAPVADKVLPDTSEYEILCAELGVSPSALSETKVRRVFQKNRIPIYDAGEVDTYMRSITPTGKYWCWKGFGHADSARSGYASSHGVHVSGAYNRLVPIHILRRMKTVKELFAGSKPLFYVTDYAVPDPDPFIKVVVDGQHIIFGVWDEPGFGDLKTEV